MAEMIDLYIERMVAWLVGLTKYFDFNPKFDWSTIVQILGFAVAIWTVNRQLKKQRDLQYENYQVGIQLEMYEKVTTEIEKSSPSGVAATVAMVPELIRHAEARAIEVGRYVPPPFDLDGFASTYGDIHTSLFRTMANIEKYEIISPNLTLFRLVLMKAVGNLSDKYIDVVKVLPYVLLSEAGIRDPQNLMRLNEKELTDMDELLQSFNRTANEVTSYLYDIQIELQNMLLGRHFDNTLPARQPKEDRCIVLTSRDEKMLSRARLYLDS